MLRNLSSDDIRVLKNLYAGLRIPTDQYKQRSGALHLLVKKFNYLTDRSDDPHDILRFIVTQRKQGKWPKLGKSHKKLKSMPMSVLTPEEWVILEEIYLFMNKGSDNYAFNYELRQEIGQKFSITSGRFVPGSILAAALETRRKKGLLPKLTPPPAIPFGDIDEVVG